MSESRGDGVIEWDLVVVGLGYVGMPMVREAVRTGMRVAGLDVDTGRVNLLNAGVSHIDDLTDGDVEALLAQGFRATTDQRVLAAADTVVICVPTPLDEDRRPDLGAVTGAAEMVAEHLTAAGEERPDRREGLSPRLLPRAHRSGEPGL
jgi:UDP-N-acetyl-D-mannosaminuronate dehydrogenase